MIYVRGGITAPRGFKASAVNCGIKRKKKDLVLIFSTTNAMSWGMFTRNRVKAAPILVSKTHLKRKTARAIIANSGNANCCTGETGLKNAHLMTELVAQELNIKKEDILIASTGIIGKQLPMDRIKEAIPRLVNTLKKNSSKAVCEGIMTTDRFPKDAAIKVRIKQRDVVLGAVAKGAGMIHPHMATMLCFITTDVNITREALKLALMQAVRTSFNSISVDGDMSTNDSVLMLANGAAENIILDIGDRDFKVFCRALENLTLSLAKSIVKDGEGATKVVSITVKNAKTKLEAEKIGKGLATSILFKSAIFGEDPNWGRVVASVGGSGVVFDPNRLDVYFDKIRVVRNGAGCFQNTKRLKDLFKKKELYITIDINKGKETHTVWTCDLTLDYVRLNAHYTT